MVIKITLKNKSHFFVDEFSGGILLVDDIMKAYNYNSTLEFKVTWDKFNLYQNDKNYINKQLVSKFEYIDTKTLVSLEFDINEQEIEIDKEIYVDEYFFYKLTDCPVKDCHCLYDKKGNFISIHETDLLEVFKIRYNIKGLIFTISDNKNWLNRRLNTLNNIYYNMQKWTLSQPLIQQIYLMNFNKDEVLTFYNFKPCGNEGNRCNCKTPQECGYN